MGDGRKEPLCGRQVGAGHPSVIGLGPKWRVEPIQLGGVNGVGVRAYTIGGDVAVPHISKNIRRQGGECLQQ